MLHLRQSDTKKIDGVDLTHIYSAANQRMFNPMTAFSATAITSIDIYFQYAPLINIDRRVLKQRLEKKRSSLLRCTFFIKLDDLPERLIRHFSMDAGKTDFGDLK